MQFLLQSEIISVIITIKTNKNIQIVQAARGCQLRKAENCETCNWGYYTVQLHGRVALREVKDPSTFFAICQYKTFKVLL